MFPHHRRMQPNGRSRSTRARSIAVVLGLSVLAAACGSESSSSSDPASTATSIAPSSSSAATAAPVSTAAAPVTSIEPTESSQPTASSEPAPESATPLLFPGDVLESGETAALPYLALDAEITVSGTGVELRSLAGSSGVGWATLQADTDEDEFSAANALTVLRVTDPAWAGGGDTQPVESIDDQLLEWFAAQPGVIAGPISEFTTEGNDEADGVAITGRRLDYTIGDLSGIGSDCSPTDPTKGLCASLLVFGPYLRGFAAGEQGTLYDLDLGSTRLVALGIGTGADVAASRDLASTAQPGDSNGTRHLPVRLRRNGHHHRQHRHRARR